jgi:hypothetical protein
MTSSVTYKHSGAIAERIEYLGKLNDRRLIANNTNDLDELERIAAEYEAHGMTTTAKELRIAIAVRRKQHTEAQA